MNMYESASNLLDRLEGSSRIVEDNVQYPSDWDVREEALRNAVIKIYGDDMTIVALNAYNDLWNSLEQRRIKRQH